jgi:tetratricopeptide (TPR) repeat protein
MVEVLTSASAEGWLSAIRLLPPFSIQGRTRNERAFGLLRRAQALHPDDFWVNHGLAWCLHYSRPPRLEEAVRYYSVAVALRPQSPGARLNLAIALKHMGDLDGAIAQYQEAIHLKADYAEAHFNLGIALNAKGRPEEAIAEYREALRLKPDFPKAHNNLGNVLHNKGRLDEAIAEYREALRLNKDLPDAHYNLGNALTKKGQLDEAVAEYRKAIRIRQDYPAAHGMLGNALKAQGRQDEAIAEYREAIRLKPDDPLAHYHLGKALRDKGRLDEAVAEYREAIRFRNDFPEASCNLGNILLNGGRFKEAVVALRRGHELGSRDPHWTNPSAQWLRKAEQMAELDERLPAVLAGKSRPKDAAERLAFAELCQEHRQRYAAAERFYEESFAAQPALAEDLSTGHRYNAACAAALAGYGQGQDAAGLDDKERARLRKQALDWLDADLAAWRRLLEKDPPKARPVVAKKMQHWLADADFAGVRGAAALGKLPEAERPGWQRLWGDVEALKRRAAASPAAGRPASP